MWGNNLGPSTEWQLGKTSKIKGICVMVAHRTLTAAV